MRLRRPYIESLPTLRYIILAIARPRVRLEGVVIFLYYISLWVLTLTDTHIIVSDNGLYPIIIGSSSGILAMVQLQV